MELIDTEAENMADEQLVAEYRLTNYVHQFVDRDQSSCDELSRAVFLKRFVSFCFVHYNLSCLYFDYECIFKEVVHNLVTCNVVSFVSLAHTKLSLSADLFYKIISLSTLHQSGLEL